MTSTLERAATEANAGAAEPAAAAGPGWRAPGSIALGLLLSAGIAVRVYALVSYAPAVLTANTHDGAGYIRAAHRGFSWGSDEPSGYPLFLRLVHAVSHALAVTIATQHCLGLASGLLLLLALRRLGAPLLLALAPAAVLWLNGDQLFLEHAPLSDSLFTFLLCAMVYCVVRALAGSWRWAAAAGALAGALLGVRTVAFLLAPVLIVVLALALWRLRAAWLRASVAAALAAAAAVGGYATIRSSETGHWTILPANSGWNLYARAAQFADCRSFTPPHGTRVLCDSTPLGKRDGPGYYRWEGGPAIQAFGVDNRNGLVRSFAIAAIVHQPLDYLRLVGQDVIRYADPAFGPQREGGFTGPAALAFPSGRIETDPPLVREVRSYYGPVHPPAGAPAHGLSAYQQALRFPPPLLALALIIALAGAPAAGGRVRWAIIVLVAISLELLLVPTLVGANWRYALPPEGPLVAAAALGAWALARTRRRKAAV